MHDLDTAYRYKWLNHIKFVLEIFQEYAACLGLNFIYSLRFWGVVLNIEVATYAIVLILIIASTVLTLHTFEY